jgi:hypothetical protein
MTVPPVSPPAFSNEIRNHFSAAFVLDKAKLTRIAAILSNRFERSGQAVHRDFEIGLSNGRTLSLSELDEVFALDNALKNPITSLTLTMDNPHTSDPRIAARVSFDDARSDNISLGVRSTDPRVAQELFAELEEQVERTILPQRMPKLFGDPSWILMTVAVGALFLLINSMRRIVSQKEDEVRKLLIPPTGTPTLDEKVTFIYEYTLRETKKVVGADVHLFPDLFTLTNLFLALPVLLIAGCIAYMVLYCYPKIVFAWGDWEDHYARLISRRKTLWTIIILSLIVGVVSSLFVSSLFHALRIS